MYEFRPDEHIDGRYRVIRPLGHGGFSSVYLVEGEDGQHYALKYLSDPASADDRFFYREVDAIRRVRHLAVVRGIMGFKDASTGRLYMVQEFVDGSSLRAMINEASEPLALEQVGNLFEQLLDLLVTLEQCEPPIVHRDVKPDNLIVGDDGHLTIVDFGIAVETDVVTRFAYSRGYSPPDFIPGRPITSDLDRFAAGVVLFETLCGGLPYDHDEPSEMFDPREYRSGLPESWALFLERACAADRNDRFDSAVEMAAAYDELLDSGGSEGIDVGLDERAEADGPELLAPYDPWPLHPVPPVMEATIDEVVEVLEEIVLSEGPVVASRAYRLYAESSGDGTVGDAAIRFFNAALKRALRKRRIAVVDDGVRRVPDKTLYMPGGEALAVRELGPRQVEQVPPSELQQLARELGLADRAVAERAAGVLEAYEIDAVSPAARAALEEALAALGDGPFPDTSAPAPPSSSPARSDAEPLRPVGVSEPVLRMIEDDSPPEEAEFRRDFVERGARELGMSAELPRTGRRRYFNLYPPNPPRKRVAACKPRSGRVEIYVDTRHASEFEHAILVLNNGAPHALKVYLRSTAAVDDAIALARIALAERGMEPGADPAPPEEPAASPHDAERDLLNAFLAGVRACRRYGYSPTLFQQMVADHGAVGAAKRLINSDAPSDGFTRLWELGHMELTVEAIVLRPEFAELFTRDELRTARARLQSYDYEI